MKNTRLAVFLAVGITGSLGAISIPSVVADATEARMADFSNPSFSALPQPIPADTSSGNRANARAYLQGVPAEAEISQIQIIENGKIIGQSEFIGQVYIRPYNEYLYVSVDDLTRDQEPTFVDGKFRLTRTFLVTYTDSSTDSFDQTFTIVPPQSVAYEPGLENSVFAPGKTSIRTLNSLPADATVRVVSTSGGWSVESNGQTISVTPPATGREGAAILAIAYADGSAETVSVDLVSGHPAESPTAPATSAQSPAKTTSVITTVTQKANPVTTTVTEVVEAPESAATVTLTEKAEVETVTTTVSKPSTASVETVTRTDSFGPATVTTTVKDEQTGSSTGSIIAAVIGLLGLIGGIGVALVGNPQLRASLPF